MPRVLAAGNDMQKTNVPDLRMRFRQETYMEERDLMLKGATQYQTRMMNKAIVAGH